jgi:PADR1, N-terminal helical domain
LRTSRAGFVFSPLPPVPTISPRFACVLTAFALNLQQQFLRWDDIQSLRKKSGEGALVDPVFEKANSDLWAMKDSINGVLKPKMMKDILEENGMKTDKIPGDILQNKVADGLLNGLIGECPECENVSSMFWNGQKYICKVRSIDFLPPFFALLNLLTLKMTNSGVDAGWIQPL